MRQILFVGGFILGILMYFAGGCAAIAVVGQVLLHTLGGPPSLLKPLWQVGVLFVVAGLLVLGAVTLTMKSLDNLKLFGKQFVAVLFFGSFAAYTLYVLFTMYKEMDQQGHIFLGVVVLLCVLAAIALPIALHHDAKRARQRKAFWDELGRQNLQAYK